MKQYLLDTNICAFMFRGKYGVREHLQKIGLRNCHISILTYAELYFGIENGGVEIEHNLNVLNTFCENIDIVGIDDVVPAYACEKARLRKSGTPIDDFDLMIGATALTHNFVLVTENLKHLRKIRDIEIENWIKRS